MKNAIIATIARLGKHARLPWCTLAALCWASTAHADLTIIEDTFTGGDGTQLESRSPDTANLPLGAWGRINTYWSSSIQGNAFQMGPDNGWTIPLDSAGGYARPGKMRISADIKVNNMDNGSGNGGGVGLGFNSKLGGGSNPHGSVTALRLDISGKLVFRRGEGGALGDLASVPWSGPAFDPYQFYNVSYEVDTITGNISNIAVTGGAGGSTADYSSLASAAAGYFTGNLVTYAYIWSNSGNGGSTAFLDNFKVERVGNALPPAISLTPVNGAKFVSGTSPILATSLLDGTGAVTVKFYVKSLPGGSFSQVGGDDTTPPYQVSLASPADGDYEVYATATDDLTTVESTHITITLQPGTGLISVDFNSNAGPTSTFSGAAAVGSGGDQWNGLVFPDGWSVNGNAYSFAPMIDSNGAAVGGVSVDLESGRTQCFDPWGANTNGSGFNNLTQDYIAYDPHFTVNGLGAGYHDFYLYGTRGTYAPVSVNGGAVKTFNGMSGSDTTTLEEGRDYLKFPVLVSGDGKLEFHATGLGGDGWAYRIAGFQIKAVPANTPPVVTTVRPANGQTYSTGSSITAKADFYYGTPPYTVQFWVDGSQVGGNVTAPPYEMPLGSLSLGSHTVFTRVIDSSTGAGPYTVDSATNTFSVAAPAITVDKDWTWNSGPEVDFSNFLTGSSTPPVHSKGQVIVPSGTYLRAQNVLSNSPVNFGMEVIVTQQDASTENRWIASARTPSWGDVFQFRMSNQSFVARNDQWGDWSQVDNLAVGYEHRMAIIITASPGDTQAVTSYYLDNVFVGSRSDPLTSDIFTRSPVQDLSIGVWHGDDGGSAGGTTAPAISVNQIRVFHFGADMFSPSLLLTAPTIAPDQAPAVTVVTPTEGQLFLTPDSVSLSSYAAYGTPPFSVQYSKRLVGGGAFSAAGAPATTPPYAVNLGTLAAGSYEIKATVTDSNGVPRSSDSAIRTITVAVPQLTVDKQYTFNSGAEADLPAFGVDSPVYADGQVTLPPSAYLQGTGLYSLPYRNFGMEVIVTQTSDTDQWRPIMHVGSTPWGNPGFHILAKKGDPRILFRDDQVGDLGNATGVPVVGTEYRLAVVVTPKPDGNVLKSFYLNGVLVGTRSDGVWDGWTLDNLMLGNCSQGIGWDGPNTTIKINEARIFHFADGRFHPSLLLTGPTPGGGGGSPYSLWAGGQAFTDDLNGDGVDNGMAWILGAANANANLDGLLPVPGAEGGLTMHFNRVNPMGSAHLYLEYSNDLGDGDPWHSEEIPATSGTFGGDITVVIIPGSPTDDVTITIPASHGSAGELFGRLKAVESPPD